MENKFSKSWKWLFLWPFVSLESTSVPAHLSPESSINTLWQSSERTFSAVFIELTLQGVARVISTVWLASCAPIPTHWKLSPPLGLTPEVHVFPSALQPHPWGGEPHPCALYHAPNRFSALKTSAEINPFFLSKPLISLLWTALGLNRERPFWHTALGRLIFRPFVVTSRDYLDSVI